MRSARLLLSFVAAVLFASSLSAQTVSVSVALQRPDPGPAVAGTQLDFLIFANNEGPSDAANVVVNTSVPTGSTFVSLTIPAGWVCPTLPSSGGTGAIQCTTPLLTPSSATFTLSVKTPPDTPQGTIIELDATISTTSPDPDTSDNHDSLTVPIVWQTNLAVTKSGPATAASGQVLTYTISATNPGPSFAANLTLTDPLPAELLFVSVSGAGWTCTTPAVGANGTVTCTNPQLAITTSTLTLQAKTSPSFAGGSVTNEVTLTATTDASSRVADATTQIAPRADLSIAKTSAPASPVVGQDLVYTITLNNGGPSDAASVVVTDPLPSQLQFVSLTAPGGWICSTPSAGSSGTITCSIATLPPGTVQFTVQTHVPPGVSAGKQITNTATATSTTPDPTAPNSATATTLVRSPATVSGTKTVSGRAIESFPVTFTIVLTNSGPAAQSDNPGDEMVDVLPSSLTLVSASATSGSAVANLGTNTVTWNGTILAGGSVTITIVATIKSGTAGTTISNFATIHFDADGNGTNESTATTGPAVITPSPAASVPTLSPLLLLALALALAALGARLS